MGFLVSGAFASRYSPDEIVRKSGVAWRGYAAVLVLAALSLYSIHFREGTFIWQLSQQEGGTYLDEALRIVQGELIYRDFFEFMTPGVFYVNAFFLWLLGPTPTTVGIMLVVIGVLCALAVYAISAAVLSNYWRFVPVAIFVGMTYPSYSPGNHKWLTIILCLVGILALAKTRSRLRCAISGIACGGAILCTQDWGVGATLGMGAALWLLRGREDGSDPIVFAAACGLTVLITLGGFAAAAGFAAVWYDVVAFMFVQYGTSHMFAVGVGSIANLPLWLTSFGLGGLGLAYALTGIAGRFWRNDSPLLVIIAFTGAGLLVIGGIAHPIEPTLFGARAVPLTIIGTYALQLTVERRLAHPWPLAGLIVLGVFVAAVAVSRPIKVQLTMPLVLEAHRAGSIWTYGPESSINDLAWLEANTVEREPVFLFPDKGGFYLLSRTHNALSYPKLFDMGFNSDAQVADAMQQIAKKCPAVGIWHGTRLLSSGAALQPRLTMKPLEQALLRDYDVVAQFANGATALRRKSSGCSS
jgi:hypothetical protein